MLSELIDASTSCYFKGLTQIFEFGCGTGHNLLRLRNVFPGTKLVGLDWTQASQNIVRKVATHLGDDLLHGLNFDFFNPDTEVKLEANSGAITVAALEQIGDSHRDFTDFLLNSDVEVAINIEPIGEVLSDDILLESISKRYFKKRNYLSGYLDRLRELEVQGRIEILHVNRAFFGSFYIEGYTIIVWKPVRK
jgi:SAM-dependent methyltransferase